MTTFILLIMINYEVATMDFNSYSDCQDTLAIIVKDTKATGACFIKLGGPNKSS